MIDKALLAKIRKCLALSRSSNEHEAAAALAKARELMEQHGLDEAALELAEVEEATARANRSMRPPRWESILANTVCHALSVIQFVDGQGDRCFIGRGPRAEVASYAFAVLFRQIKAARGDYIKSALRRCKQARKRARADVFCEGWAIAVYAQVRGLMPAPLEDAALSRFLSVQHPGLVGINSRAAKASRSDTDYWRGIDRGSEVTLNMGVGGGTAPLAIGR